MKQRKKQRGKKQKRAKTPKQDPLAEFYRRTLSRVLVRVRPMLADPHADIVRAALAGEAQKIFPSQPEEPSCEE